MRLKLLTTMLFISLYASAQNYVGWNKEELVSQFYNDNRKDEYKTEWGRTTSGVDYVSYLRDDEVLKTYFFGDNGRCDIYVIFYPYSYLNNIVDNLNKKFSSMGDFVWLDYNQSVDYKWEIKREDGFFSVICSIYQRH